MQQNSGGLIDVLRGDKPVKLEVSIDTTSMVYLGITILIAVAIAVIIAKKIS